ncbi:hypothetical protein LY10_03987 [Planktotalea frisia]|uniref:Uncharacterized protein n=1 Tax=Planktotalea frisia TaxID=696762 RepID=A0A1L9P1B6_9RHOB|nr:hypothetical protein PFRI_04810 [Planktotalea frisia]PZX20189.1 hypothetical protein LY10_03987 [Planktotalea frisia]
MQNFLMCLLFLTFSSQTCAADDNYNFLVRRDSLLASSSPKFPILGKPIDLSNSLGERFLPALKRYPNLSSCLGVIVKSGV